MKSLKPVAALAFIVAVAVSISAQGPAKISGISDAGKAALTAQMNDAVKRGDAPGIDEIVVNREGVLYEGASGLPPTRSSTSRR